MAGFEVTPDSWANLPLGRVIIDEEMAVAGLGEEREFGPARQAVGDGLAEDALREDGQVARGRAQASVQLEKKRNGSLGAKDGTVGRAHALHLCLEPVECAEENEKWGGAVVAGLNGRNKAPSRMGHTGCSNDPVARQRLQRSVVGREPVGLENALKALEESLGWGVATAFVKLEDDAVLLRGMHGPEPGVAGLAAPLGSRREMGVSSIWM